MSPASLARDLARRLASEQRRIVFAESCTGGLAAATLAQVPGISQWFCGSAVTYREQTKIQWLNVSDATLRQQTAVSPAVTGQMATGVLRQSAEADLSIAVTGHLGPDAPPDLDGVVYVATAVRHRHGEIGVADVRQYRLQATERTDRQREAVERVLQAALRAVAGGSGEGSDGVGE